MRKIFESLWNLRQKYPKKPFKKTNHLGGNSMKMTRNYCESIKSDQIIVNQHEWLYNATTIALCIERNWRNKSSRTRPFVIVHLAKASARKIENRWLGSHYQLNFDYHQRVNVMSRSLSMHIHKFYFHQYWGCRREMWHQIIVSFAEAKVALNAKVTNTLQWKMSPVAAVKIASRSTFISFSVYESISSKNALQMFLQENEGNAAKAIM